MMFGYYNYWPFTGYGIIGMILMVLFWLLIIWLIVAVIRRIIYGGGRNSRWHDWRDWNGRERYPHDKSAMDILRERYARGEIDKAEFEARKRDLET